MSFSKEGAGVWLADTFNKELQARPNSFPNIDERGITLGFFGDFGGQHKGQFYDTYVFLILDLERNGHWFREQSRFRSLVMPNRRRISFKAMNDGYRRRALVPFLDIANNIEGWLVSIAISKKGDSIFEISEDSNECERILAKWKPSVRERLLRITHLSAFLLSGLSSPGQDVYWFIDEDEIASNIEQLTQLTEIVARVSSNSLSYDLGHMKCGTTKSDDGTLTMEDFVAICDLTAGAFSEIATSMVKQKKTPLGKVATGLPTGLSWKSRVLATWLAYSDSPLQKISCVVELGLEQQIAHIKTLKWHAYPGNLVLPKHPLYQWPRG